MKLFRFLIGAAILNLSAVPLSAAPGSAALTELVACRSVKDMQERDSCYLNASRTLERRVASGELRISGIPAAQEPKALFGLTRTTARDAFPVEIKEVASTVSGRQPFGYDRWIIQLKNGATWRTLESSNMLEPRIGTPVVVRRGSLGGYFLEVKGERAQRAERIK